MLVKAAGFFRSWWPAAREDGLSAVPAAGQWTETRRSSEREVKGKADCFKQIQKGKEP